MEGGYEDMSKTVDERVVSMQFDNSQFEKNVKTSMSTLDKLKQSLNFKDSAKGLESINAAAKNTNLSGLSAGIETVRTKFSAMQVMGITALTNIMNTAVNAGKRMVSALTIDPIKTGFDEYETKINSIQTIMSNTASKGTTMEDVTRVIDDLNTYADKTIYNFAEMTRNIGTFTAAGVGLEKSASAIKGIANLAAASGSNSQQASTAMYQLSQALAAGTVKLQDWNSVVNAGMGGEKFQEALKATAREHGVAIDSIIKKQGSFRESLKTGWMTADILNETLNKFTVDGAKKYAKSMVESGKWTKKQADALVKEAQSMEDAATKVKTFTQLWDTLKEAAQSGWGKTWELIIGDFDQAKDLFTKLSKFFGGMIDRMSDARNAVLQSALGKGFKGLSKSLDTVIEPAKKVTKAVSDLGNIVDKVIAGDFGNGQERFDALTKAGQNFYRVQNKVNETLGNSHRYTAKQIAEQDKLIKGTDKETKGTTKLTEEKKNLIKKVASMTEEQMRSKGYTDKQIAAFKELGATADKLGMPLNEFINNMDKINGRWLLLRGFENIGKSILSVFKTISKAWKEVFPPKSTKEKSEALFNLIAAFHKFSASLKMNKDTADKLKRTFKGLFAILDLVSTITGGAFKIAFKAVTMILGVFDLSLLDVTAVIGDAIVGFRDWTKSILDFTKIFKGIGKFLKSAVDGTRDWISGLKEADNIPQYVIQGLINGLKNGIAGIAEASLEIGKSIINTIKNFLEIHSPSKKMEEIGTYAIEGLSNGLLSGIKFLIDGVKKIASILWNTFSNLDFSPVSNGVTNIFATSVDKIGITLSSIIDVVKTVITKVFDLFGNIDFGALFAGLVSGGYVVTIYKLAKAFEALSKPIAGLGDVLTGFGRTLDTLPKAIKAFSFKLRTEGLKNIGIAILLLVASIAVLTHLDPDKVDQAVNTILQLSLIMIGLSFAMEKMSKAAVSINKNGATIGGLKSELIAIGTAMVLMAATLKIIGSLNSDQYKQAIDGMLTIVVSLISLIAVYAFLVNGEMSKNIDKLGKMLKSMAVSMVLMAAVMKILGGMDPAEMDQGFSALAKFAIIIGFLTFITILAGDSFEKLGKTLLAMSASMLIMAIVVKLLGGMDPTAMEQGFSAIREFAIIIGFLTFITELAGDSFEKLGKTLLAMSASMLIMSIVVKLLGGMDPTAMEQGFSAIREFAVIVAALTLVVGIMGKDSPKIAATLLAMSVSIAILAGVAILLGMIDLPGLAKGVIAVSILGLVMAGMVDTARDVENCKGTIMAMAVAIGVMAASVAVLSMIDPTKLFPAAIALSMVMGMFALIVEASSDVQGSLGSLIVMTIAVGLIGGLIYVLSGLPIESVLGSAAALSVVLLSMSAAMFIASKAGPTALAGVKALAVLGLVVAELALILGLMSKFDVQPSIETALALSILLTSMSASLILLGVVGLMGPEAFMGIAALATMIAGIGALIVGIGALITKFPQLEEFLNTGIPILEKIGHAIGSFFGNIVGGFVEGATSGLSKLATTLSQFITGLAPFISGVKSIDPSVVDNVKTLASVIMIITGASLLESIASFLTGESSITQFASELPVLGNGLKAFSDSVNGINAENVTAAANAAKALAEMADTIPNEGGMVAWFTGENSMSKFAGELPTLGSGLKSFSDSVNGINAENLTAAANAGKTLAEMCSVIPNEGGVAAWFAGENSISSFGNELPELGKGLLAFSAAAMGIQLQPVKDAVEAGKAITDMCSTIPNEGGVAAWFSGENSISNFADSLPKLAKGLFDFSVYATGLDIASVNAATSAAKSIAEMSATIPKEGGIKAWFTGESSITKFAGELPKLGKGLNEFSDSLEGMNATNVNSAANAAKSLAEMTKNAPSDPSKIVEFGEKLEVFGGKLKLYFNKVSGVSSNAITAASKAVTSVMNSTKNIDLSKMSQASSAIDQLVNSLKSAGGLSVKTTMGFTNALKGIGDAGVNSLLNAFKNANSKLQKAGSGAIDKIISGAKSKSDEAKKAFQKVVTDSTKNISLDEFYTIGEYAVEGFANGIDKNTFKAEAKASAMAEASEKAAKKTLRERSPSKEFFKIGDFAGLGFVNALGDYEKKSYKAGSKMAMSAKNGISKAIANIANLVDTDIDSQPTIRPVLDLSDVSNGAGAINGMFDMQPSVGVMSNLRAINSSMNDRQNGNSELLSAVKGLRKDFANSNGGVTVDVHLDYNAGSDANEIANDIATSLRRAIRRGV